MMASPKWLHSTEAAAATTHGRQQENVSHFRAVGRITYFTQGAQMLRLAVTDSV